MTNTEILQIFTGFIGSFGFAILFNIRGKKLLMAALGGFLSWAIFVLVGYCGVENEPIRYFMVAAAITAYAELMARLYKTPTTTFIMTALIPLIPGSSLYYTMVYAFNSNLERFIDKAIYTLQLSVSLALGIMLAGALAKIILRQNARKKSSN